MTKEKKGGGGKRKRSQQKKDEKRKKIEDPRRLSFAYQKGRGVRKRDKERETKGRNGFTRFGWGCGGYLAKKRNASLWCTGNGGWGGDGGKGKGGQRTIREGIFPGSGKKIERKDVTSRRGNSKTKISIR